MRCWEDCDFGFGRGRKGSIAGFSEGCETGKFRDGTIRARWWQWRYGAITMNFLGSIDEAPDFILEAVRNVGCKPAGEINLKVDATLQDRYYRFKGIT